VSTGTQTFTCLPVHRHSRVYRYTDIHVSTGTQIFTYRTTDRNPLAFVYFMAVTSQ